MKKICLILALFCTLNTVFISAYAEDYATVIINGAVLETDRPAEIINGRTMVPLRAIFEALGASVEWVDEEKGILSQKGNVGIVMQVGNTMMAKYDVRNAAEDNLDYIELDVAPIIQNGRTLVPARAIAEAYNCDVQWDDNARAVYINSGNSAAYGGAIGSVSSKEETRLRSFEFIEYSRRSADMLCRYEGSLYYTFGQQQCIFRSDNNGKQKYYTGGKPIAMTIYNRYIYYANEGQGSLYRINIDTSKKETLTSNFETFNSCYIFGDVLVLCGTEATGEKAIYGYDIASGENGLIYSFDAGSLDTTIEDDRYIKFVHQTREGGGESGYIKSTTAAFIDIKNMEFRRIFYSDVGGKSFSMEDFGFKDDYVYLRRTSSNFEDATEYMRGDLDTKESVAVSMQEFLNSIEDESDSSNDGLSYKFKAINDASQNSLLRQVYMDGEWQANEKIYSSATDITHTTIHVIYTSDDLVVFEEVFSRQDPTVYTSFKFIYDASRMFVMNPNTLEIQEYDFYSKTIGGAYPCGLGGTTTYTGTGWVSNESASGNNNTSQSQTNSGGAKIENSSGVVCGACGGTGKETCFTCRGTGWKRMDNYIGVGNEGNTNIRERCSDCIGGLADCKVCHGIGKRY